MSAASMTASDLFALALGTRNAGKERCHWCGSACSNLWLHDDPPPIPFHRTKSTAKVPSSRHVCVGCWNFKRKKVTVRFLDETLKDSQAGENHSWWITETGSFGVRAADGPHLYPLLLKPPLWFALALKDGNGPNLMQLMTANRCEDVKGDTPLSFTYNGVKHEYTVYELEQALQHGPEGKEPGVQLLLKTFGSHSLTNGVPEAKRKVGRPKMEEKAPDGRSVMKLITSMSGS